MAAFVLLGWFACSADIEQAPQLAECHDAKTCGPGLSMSSPLARNDFNQPEAGAGADAGVFDVGIQQETIPEAGPGPGISGITGASTPVGSSGELGPICPATQPTNGAPCDPIANSVPCAYGRVTCSCVGTWTCF